MYYLARHFSLRLRAEGSALAMLSRAQLQWNFVFAIPRRWYETPARMRACEHAARIHDLFCAKLNQPANVKLSTRFSLTGNAAPGNSGSSASEWLLYGVFFSGATTADSHPRFPSRAASSRDCGEASNIRIAGGPSTGVEAGRLLMRRYMPKNKANAPQGDADSEDDGPKELLLNGRPGTRPRNLISQADSRAAEQKRR